MAVDAIIVGGGPAGASCACALARGGMSCVIVDCGSAGRKVGEVIDSEIRLPLTELGLWEKFLRRGYFRSSGTISLWGDGITERSAAISPYGGGFFVDRPDLNAWLLEEAEHFGVRVLKGAKATAAKRTNGIWHVEVSRNAHCMTLTSPLLIEASGRASSLRGANGSYRLDALVALVAYPRLPEAARDLRMSIEGMPNGWWYMAALPDQKLVLAFLTDADLLPNGTAGRTEFFQRNLSASHLTKTRFDLGSGKTEIRTIPAMSSIRQEIPMDGRLAIGDAASTYDPLAGFGVAVAASKGLAAARLLLVHGFETAAREYNLAERSAFLDYIAVRKSIYRMEMRWPELIFWQRRHALPSTCGMFGPGPKISP